MTTSVYNIGRPSTTNAVQQPISSTIMAARPPYPLHAGMQQRMQNPQSQPRVAMSLAGMTQPVTMAQQSATGRMQLQQLQRHPTVTQQGGIVQTVGLPQQAVPTSIHPRLPQPQMQQQQRPPAQPMQVVSQSTLSQLQAHSGINKHPTETMRLLKEHQCRLLAHKAKLLSNLKEKEPHGSDHNELQHQIQNITQQEVQVQGQINAERLAGPPRYQDAMAQQTVLRHPAPLPVLPTPPRTVLLPHQLQLPLPGKPNLKISKVNNGIVLSWTMTIDPSGHPLNTIFCLPIKKVKDLPVLIYGKK
ncbi:uncharacterized protein LOC100369342 isoform X1 [Saccoglossus kowalevskii]|uniref:Activating transcription factor 7-interacting protein 1-like isoform X2 n=1 Tax=Saccoglossus kowalevskii TaxID=10224 RepID=A0ABM0MNQ4_SACKO|nr:PREDICTED: activating transcription factor 7-interacting protein 1-like isoform X2 [Saccoglossus kowalevskii]